MIAAVAFHYDDAVVSYAPRCEYGDCDGADLVNGLCSAHGADCWACDRRFEPRELCGGVCGECSNGDDACDNLGAPLPAMGVR